METRESNLKLDMRIPTPGRPCRFCGNAVGWLTCATCRVEIDNRAEAARRVLFSIANTFPEVWEQEIDNRPIAQAMVGPARAVILKMNISALEVGVAAGAPIPIIERLCNNISSIGNPRSVRELDLLTPRFEWEVILQLPGVRDADPQNAHFRALFRRGVVPPAASKEVARDVLELGKAWAFREDSEHWRDKLQGRLRSGDKKKINLSLQRGESTRRSKGDFKQHLKHHLDVALHLSKEEQAIRPEESFGDYMDRLLGRQTKVVREAFRGEDPKRVTPLDKYLEETIPASDLSDDGEAALARLSRQLGLSPREQLVWYLKYAGFSQVYIADRLGVSQPRVSQILVAIGRKISKRILRTSK